MSFEKYIIAGLTAVTLVAAAPAAMAQSTGTGNNATSGAQPDASSKSGMEQKSDGGSSNSMKMKDETPTSAGTSENQAKDLRGHSETPTTGSGK